LAADVEVCYAVLQVSEVVSETVKADATHIHDDVVDKLWCPDIYQYAQLFGLISKSIRLLDSNAHDMASG
jgi:hypothetical protein